MQEILEEVTDLSSELVEEAFQLVPQRVQQRTNCGADRMFPGRMIAEEKMGVFLQESQHHFVQVVKVTPSLSGGDL